MNLSADEPNAMDREFYQAQPLIAALQLADAHEDVSEVPTWETPDEAAATVERMRARVAAGMMTLQEADTFAIGELRAESFCQIFADDPAFRPHEVSWRPSLATAWIASKGDRNLLPLKLRELRLQPKLVDCRAAETALRSALLSGQLTMTGIRDGERIPIPKHEWNDLIFARHGSADVLAFGSRFNVRYIEPCVEGAAVRHFWREQTVATRRAASMACAEAACVKTLVGIMKENPTRPIPKAKLTEENFPKLSKRAFDRAYALAAVEAGTPNWRARGRRPSKNPQG